MRIYTTMLCWRTVYPILASISAQHLRAVTRVDSRTIFVKNKCNFLLDHPPTAAPDWVLTRSIIAAPRAVHKFNWVTFRQHIVNVWIRIREYCG